MASVRAVAFDLGGVLTPPVASTVDGYGREVGLPAGYLSGFFRGDADFALVEVGAMSSRDFLKRVCIRTRDDTGVDLDIRRLAAAAEAAGVPDPDMLALVADVRRRCMTALLTNNVREATGWRQAIDARLFHVIVDSSEVGLRKPDPAIYRLLLERLGCTPGDVVFVDDFAENLGPAAALGIRTVLFVDRASCRATLEELGAVEIGAGARRGSAPATGEDRSDVERARPGGGAV